MKVFFVGAGPGDPELLTLKGARLLKECKCCIWAGSLVNPTILEFLPKDCQTYDSSTMELSAIIDVIKSCRDTDTDVIRLHTGEPVIYGAIGEQIAQLQKLDIAYEIVPGISSFQAAAAVVGCELTSPEISQTIVITRTGGRTPVPQSQTLEKIAPLKATCCVFLSIDKIGGIVQEMAPVYGWDCPIAVVYHASWPNQVLLKGTLQDIEEKVKSAGLTRTGMIIIGEALAGAKYESRLYDSSFTHGYREGTT
jgi:precorrin-4/cobalt-precorrin-4 C11-methyltransferase